MRKSLLFLLSAILTIPAYATGDVTITSKGYVDTAIATKQPKFPAAGQTTGGAGERVMTYTSTNGTIGERALYTDPTSYTDGTDAGKLITASALNSAFSNLPTTTTSKLVCQNSPACTLWTITDQTAYGNSGGGSGGDNSAAVMAMLTALVNTNGTGQCHKPIHSRFGNGSTGTCTTPLTNYGDWGVTFTYDDETIQISGISVCSGVNETGIPTSQSQIQDDYDSYDGGWPAGTVCHCKMTDPNTSAALWVYEEKFYDRGTNESGVDRCFRDCPSSCATKVRTSSSFRQSVFGIQ